MQCWITGQNSFGDPNQFAAIPPGLMTPYSLFTLLKSVCLPIPHFRVLVLFRVYQLDFFHMHQYRVNWNVDYLNGVFVCHWLPPTAITPGSLVALAFNALGPAVIPDVVSYNMLVP